MIVKIWRWVWIGIRDKYILQAGFPQESDGIFFNKEFNRVYQKNIVHKCRQSQGKMTRDSEISQLYIRKPNQEALHS